MRGMEPGVQVARRGPIRVSLGQRFPRWLAALLGLVPAAILAYIATMQQYAPFTWRVGAWMAAIAIVAWLFFVPLGYLEYDPQNHLRRCGGRRRKVSPDATVVIGDYITPAYVNAFGIRVTEPDGSSELLYRTGSLSTASAVKIRDALQQAGLTVRMVALDELSREVEWKPAELPTTVIAFGVLGILPWSGFIFGAVLNRPGAVVLADRCSGADCGAMASDA
jgi:hypothetical protein